MSIVSFLFVCFSWALFLILLFPVTHRLQNENIELKMKIKSQEQDLQALRANQAQLSLSIPTVAQTSSFAAISPISPCFSGVAPMKTQGEEHFIEEVSPYLKNYEEALMYWEENHNIEIMNPEWPETGK